MTELQLKIRRLAHRVSTLKKKGKEEELAKTLTEITELRAQRKDECVAERAAAKAKKSDDAAGTDAAPAEAPANG